MINRGSKKNVDLKEPLNDDKQMYPKYGTGDNNNTYNMMINKTRNAGASSSLIPKAPSMEHIHGNENENTRREENYYADRKTLDLHKTNNHTALPL